MSIWLRQHWQTFGLTLTRLARNPLATLLNVTVIGVALALPLGGYMLLQTLGSVARQLTGNPLVSLFLARDADKADIAALEARLKQMPGVRALRFISREQALEGLKQSENLADVISANRNFLTFDQEDFNGATVGGEWLRVRVGNDLVVSLPLETLSDAWRTGFARVVG